jgi:hypothetical protein
MTTMTKKTVATFPTMVMSMTPFQIAVFAEISDLFETGKTDGKGTLFYNFEWNGANNEYVLYINTRNWVDQAAAEEWRDFLFSSSELYNLNIISVEIEDI